MRREELARGNRRKPYDSEAAAAARKRTTYFESLINEGTEAELLVQLKRYGAA